MTFSVKHTKVSAKADGPDTTLIQPTNWNAEHTLTAAAGKVLGRDNSGAGAVQELPIAVTASGDVDFVTVGYLHVAKGTTAQRPGTPAAGMLRYNTTTVKFEQYVAAWASFATEEYAYAAARAVLSEAFTDITSAAQTDIGAVVSRHVRILGTTNINAFDVATPAGTRKTVWFAGALTLAHNATWMILPGGANIITAANDTAEFICWGLGNWLCLWYKRASGQIVAPVPAFMAHKNGVAQVDSSAAIFKLTFGFEEFDIGGYFDVALSRWTPPAGQYVLAGAMWSQIGASNTSRMTLSIRKNGVEIKTKDIEAYSYRNIEMSIDIVAVVTANGTDYFELWGLNLGLAGETPNISGSIVHTWFSGK